MPIIRTMNYDVCKFDLCVYQLRYKCSVISCFSVESKNFSSKFFVSFTCYDTVVTTIFFLTVVFLINVLNSYNWKLLIEKKVRQKLSLAHQNVAAKIIKGVKSAKNDIDLRENLRIFAFRCLWCYIYCYFWVALEATAWCTVKALKAIIRKEY